MIVNTKEQNREIIIDLRGPEGNVFVLMSYAKTYARQLGLNYEEIRRDMMSSDYENAVQVFDKHFGSFVTLLR